MCRNVKVGGDVDRDLTEMQKSFVENHLMYKKKKQTQAAIDAGYSERTAASQASRLLKNVKIQEYLEHREQLLVDELRQEFIFDAIEARKVMNKILNDEEARDMDRINVAKDFLDRAGFKPVEKQETKITGELEIEERSELFNKYLK